MNTERFEKLEHRRLLQLAREYEKKGYKVDLEPSRFPSFIRDRRPDLIAVSEDDKVVVEVVSSQTIGNRERLEQLARSVESKSGWRFELVVTNPKEQHAKDITLPEIEFRIKQAKDLDNSGDAIPALLIQYSAVEALLRTLALQEEAGGKGLSSIKLIKTLYSLGVVSRYEFERLELAAQSRNLAAHGFMLEETMLANDINTLLFDIGDRLLLRILGQDKPSKLEHSPEELVRWFFDHFEDPAEGVPYEGGYIYVLGGPYDAWEEITAQFPEADEEVIQAAMDRITPLGIDWVRRGQY